MASTSDLQIFAKSIFPKAFGTAAQESYMESQDTYASLLEGQTKYNAIMNAIGSILYCEMGEKVEVLILHIRKEIDEYLRFN